MVFSVKRDISKTNTKNTSVRVFLSSVDFVRVSDSARHVIEG